MVGIKGDSLNRIFDVFTDWNNILGGLNKEVLNDIPSKKTRRRIWNKTGLAVRKKAV